MRNLDPDVPTVLIGTTRFATIVGKSVPWARKKLREWLAEQERGGPIRIVTKGYTPANSKHQLLYTTLGILQREFGSSIRDPYIMRKLAEQERDLDFLAKRVDFLTSELTTLKQLLNRKR